MSACLLGLLLRGQPFIFHVPLSKRQLLRRLMVILRYFYFTMLQRCKDMISGLGFGFGLELYCEHCPGSGRVCVTGLCPARVASQLTDAALLHWSAGRLKVLVQL